MALCQLPLSRALNAAHVIEDGSKSSERFFSVKTICRMFLLCQKPHMPTIALDCCVQFCRKHSATARRLRFLRKVPALRGVPDTELLAATASAAEHNLAVRLLRTTNPAWKGKALQVTGALHPSPVSNKGHCVAQVLLPFAGYTCAVSPYCVHCAVHHMMVGCRMARRWHAAQAWQACL